MEGCFFIKKRPFVRAKQLLLPACMVYEFDQATRNWFFLFFLSSLDGGEYHKINSREYISLGANILIKITSYVGDVRLGFNMQKVSLKLEMKGLIKFNQLYLIN